jgi:protein-S-isoprenylcysteine O-methyltransferase Ste14
MQADHNLTNTHTPPLMRRARLQAALQRWRVSLSFAFSVIALILAEPTVRLILIGGSLALLGVGLRAWAAGHLKKDQELSTGGPYAYTRNPLYLGSFLIGLGGIIACGSLLLLVAFLILFFLLYASAMTREAPHLRRLFPEQYPQYERAVPVFLPRLTPYPGAVRSRFSLALFKSHREHRVGFILLLVLAILLVKATLVSARTWSTNWQAAQPVASEKRTNLLPFAEGETLQYEARYSKLFLSGKIGVLTFTFTRSTEPPLIGHHLIKVDVVSDGFWPKLLGIDVKDVFESFVDPADFGVARTRKQLSHQGKKEFELAVFDRKNSIVMLISRDLTKATAQPEVKQEPTRPWVQDIVSATYHLRTLPLTVGQTIEIPLSDSGKTYDIQAKVETQEQLQTGLGQFSALKVQPLIFGEGKLIRKEGELYIWLTDDARRLPVRAWVQSSFGTATIELTSMPIH